MTNRMRRTERGDGLSAAVLLLPSFVLLTVFVIVPLGFSFVSSFFDHSIKDVSTFVGFKTYGRIFTESMFWRSMWVGLRYAIVIVPLQLVLAFLLASLITKLTGRLSSALKVSLYIPCVLSGVVVGTIFLSLFQEKGVVNAILAFLYKPFEAMGAAPFEAKAWFADGSVDWFICCIAVIWAGLGYTTLIILGGLYDIPQDYYEAAKMDGANVLERLWYITLPSLKNVLVYVLISLAVSAIQVFEIPFVMTGKGALNFSTMGPIGYIYAKNSDMVKDVATTSSLIIGVIIAALASVIFKFISSEKSEA